MTDLETLKTQLKTVLDREADGHHLHDAIVDALDAEIERAHKALFRAIQLAEHCDDIECVDTFSEVCHCRAAYYAALSAQDKVPTA